ncbi:Fic family protein [Patescibacteria group bacterium]|nr:Fic family protein [Patescibacteria group bacterium]MBU1683168.1 Fic family protein [Patescibacteria group bacterium]MBU1934424.1 Fic family protein [Patescibacteria group bacterium]
MKYINRKVIKGKAQYYIQYQGYSKYIGSFLPTNLKEELSNFFIELTEKESDNLPDNIKNEFKYGGLDKLEKLHYLHIALNHDLLKKEHDNFYNEFIKLYTYHSNRSEGSKTTKRDIDKFISKKIKSPKTKTDQEIFNSFLAFNFAISSEMKWNMKSIKHIHALLLDDIDPLIAGKWKNEDNVAPGQQFTTEYKKVPDAMKNLIAWLKSEFKKKTYPPKIALQFYVKLEHIHPFLDGNGRVGRILLNAILHKFNYPPIVFFSENHQQHCTGMKHAIKGRWEKMNKHFLLQVRKTNDSLFRKILP